MKRKIAILLATTMTLSAVPTFAAKTKAPALEGVISTVANGQTINKLNSDYTDVTASSVNDVDKVKAYQSALRQREAVLKIGIDKLSTQEIAKGDTFTIQLENGKFAITGQDPAQYAYRNVSFDKGTDKTIVSYVQGGKLYTGEAGSGVEVKETSFEDVLNKIMPDMTGMTDETKASGSIAALPNIPYSINIKDETTAEITFLTSIEDLDITKETHKMPGYYGTTTTGNTTVGAKKGTTEAYLAIPLGEVESTGGEEVKVKVAGFSNTITDGTVTIAKTVGSGSTRIDTSYITKKVFELDLEPSDLIVRENTKNSFENGKEITLRLSSGFKFNDNTRKLAVEGVGSNTSIALDGNAVYSEDKTKVTFKLTNTDISKTENIKITLPQVVAINENNNYGEVSLTISGNGISTETVVIGERQKLGFKLETKTEVPTITKGRYVDLNSSLSSKESTSAEFEFSEAVPSSLLAGRSVDFTVPSGVKIVDAKLVSNSGISFKDFNSAFSIINDGTTLRLERNQFTVPSGNNTGRLRLQLKLSVDAGFSGEEVKLSVTGGGISETLEAVIAKVQNPFTITATPKNINIGYQDYSVNDIVITETAPGMFMEGGKLNLAIQAPYGTDQMGFTNANVKVTGGNLEIKPVSSQYLSNNQISINIKTQSTKEPATITISDVKIGTTRSVPYGAYNLKVDGNAVINNNLIDSSNNYVTGVSADTVKNVNFNLDAPTTELDKAKRIDTENGSYQVQGYVNVITATDTIDREMKVTIGSTTAMIEGKEVTMDVAPYIQANGNTMVPLRFVTVALAGGDATSVESAQNSDKISWDANSKTVTIFYGAGINQKIIQFKIGSKNMIVDGNTIPMENGAHAEIKDGRTFVPFRSLGQALGVTVSWDATNKTAIFNQK